MKTNIVKILLAAAACLAASFTALADDTIIAPSALPKKARAFVETHFPGTEIVLAEKDSDSYEVRLKNNVEIEFRRNGEWENIDGNKSALPDSVVPSAILTHLRKHFPGASVLEIERKFSGYEIETDKYHDELSFDRSGNPTSKTRRIFAAVSGAQTSGAAVPRSR